MSEAVAHSDHLLPPPVETSLLRLQANDLDLASTLVLPTPQPNPRSELVDGSTTVKRNPISTWISHTLRRKAHPLANVSEESDVGTRPIKRQRSLFFRARHHDDNVMNDVENATAKQHMSAAGLWMISVSEKGDENGLLALYVTGKSNPRFSLEARADGQSPCPAPNHESTLFRPIEEVKQMYNALRAEKPDVSKPHLVNEARLNQSPRFRPISCFPCPLTTTLTPFVRPLLWLVGRRSSRPWASLACPFDRMKRATAISQPMHPGASRARRPAPATPRSCRLLAGSLAPVIRSVC